jgi:hypothetical protein
MNNKKLQVAPLNMIFFYGLYCIVMNCMNCIYCMHCILRSKDNEGLDSFANNTTFLQSHFELQIGWSFFAEIIIGNSSGADGVPCSRAFARLTFRSAPHQHQQK